MKTQPGIKTYLAGIAAAAFTLSAHALPFNSDQSGNYNDSNTWAEAGNPDNGAADDVTINVGHTVTITGGNQADQDDITVVNGATLAVEKGDDSNNLADTNVLLSGTFFYDNNDKEGRDLDGNFFVRGDNAIFRLDNEEDPDDDKNTIDFDAIIFDTAGMKLTMTSGDPDVNWQSRFEGNSTWEGLNASADGTLQLDARQFVEIIDVDIDPGVTLTITGPGDAILNGDMSKLEGTLASKDSDTIVITNGTNNWGSGKLRADPNGVIEAEDLDDGRLDGLTLELAGGELRYNNSDNSDDLGADLVVSADSLLNNYKDDDTSDAGDTDDVTFKSLSFATEGLTLTIDEQVPGNPGLNANTERTIFEAVNLPDSTTFNAARGDITLKDIVQAKGDTATIVSSDSVEIGGDGSNFQGTLILDGADTLVLTENALGTATIRLNNGARLGVDGEDKEPLVNAYLGNRIIVTDSTVAYDNFNEDGSGVDVGGDFVFAGNSTFINTRSNGGNNFNHRFGTFDFAAGDPTVRFRNFDTGDKEQRAIFNGSVVNHSGTISIEDTNGSGESNTGVQFNGLTVRPGVTITLETTNDAALIVNDTLNVTPAGGAGLINFTSFTIIDDTNGTLIDNTTAISSPLWNKTIGSIGASLDTGGAADLGTLTIGPGNQVPLSGNAGFVELLGGTPGEVIDLLLDLGDASLASDLVAYMTGAGLDATLLSGQDPFDISLALTLPDTGPVYFTYDFSDFDTQSGQQTPTQLQAAAFAPDDTGGSPVPEPVSGVLVMLGLVGLAARRRR